MIVASLFSEKKTDPGKMNLNAAAAVVVVVVQHLTWKSDVPCTGEGQRGYEGRASQCVSMAESTLQRLSDDLEGKEEQSCSVLCLMRSYKQSTNYCTVKLSQTVK